MAYSLNLFEADPFSSEKEYYIGYKGIKTTTVLIWCFPDLRFCIMCLKAPVEDTFLCSNCTDKLWPELTYIKQIEGRKALGITKEWVLNLIDAVKKGGDFGIRMKRYFVVREMMERIVKVHSIRDIQDFHGVTTRLLRVHEINCKKRQQSQEGKLEPQKDEESK